MKRIPKPVRRIIITAASLFILFIVAGIVYVFISDQQTASKTPVVASAPKEVSPLPKATPPAANAAEGAAVEALTSPVSVGSNSSITVATNAGSTCTISVTYNDIASKDSGLVPKKADAYGNVTWTWTVGNTTPLGSWPVKVTCTYNGRTGVVIDNLQVTK